MSATLTPAKVAEFASEMAAATAKVPNGHALIESGWILAGIGVHRDSDALAESNYAVAMRMLAEAAEIGYDVMIPIGYIGHPYRDQYDLPLGIAHFRHWAVGWIDEMVIRADHAELVTTAARIRDMLADYPALDEDHYIEHEWNRNHPGDGECYSDDPDCCGNRD